MSNGYLLFLSFYIVLYCYQEDSFLLSLLRGLTVSPFSKHLNICYKSKRAVHRDLSIQVLQVVKPSFWKTKEFSFKEFLLPGTFSVLILKNCLCLNYIKNDQQKLRSKCKVYRLLSLEDLSTLVTKISTLEHTIATKSSWAVVYI